MGRGCFNGVIRVIMMESLLRMRLRGMGFINGRIRGGMKVSGYIIKCMELGSLVGRMEGIMREITLMIRRKGKGNLFGLMGGFIRGSGGRGSSMARESILRRELLERGFGLMEKGRSGLVRKGRWSSDNNVFFVKVEF